jgi:hypothetical protein
MFNVINPVAVKTFDTQEECDRYTKTIADSAGVHVLTDWDQLESICTASATYTSSSSSTAASSIGIDAKTNVFTPLKQLTFGKLLLGKLSDITYYQDKSSTTTTTKVINSLRYLFFHRGEGIFVSIHDGLLRVFAPFRNTDYVDIASDSNGASVPSGALEPLLNMLVELCTLRRIPNVNFFITTSASGPQIERDLSDLKREKHDSYAPICSAFSSMLYGDILIPSIQDWLSCTKQFFAPTSGTRGNVSYNPFAAAVKGGTTVSLWGNKKSICFFRGSGSTPQRIQLAQLSEEWDKPDHRFKGFLDARLSSGPLGHFVPMHSQFEYKFTICFSGPTGSNRLNYLLGMGSLIFLVDSSSAVRSFTETIIRYAAAATKKPLFISVKADLSDLAEKIAWAKSHDSECANIAMTAKHLHNRLFTKRGLLDYWQLLTQLIASPLGAKVLKVHKRNIDYKPTPTEKEIENANAGKKRRKVCPKILEERRQKKSDFDNLVRGAKIWKFESLERDKSTTFKESIF